MKDLRDPRWMYLKAALMLGIGAVSSLLLFLERPTLLTAVLIALAVWAFARAYYFAFYVVERYIDPTYRFSGLLSLARYLLMKR